MQKFIILSVLAATLTTTAYAQAPLRPESPGSSCTSATEPLSPNSNDARRLLNSDDPNDQACAELRIALWEQLETEEVPPEETKLETHEGISAPSFMPSALLPLLQMLNRFFGNVS